MRYRIVLYRDGALPEKVLGEIERMTGHERQPLVAQLRMRPAVLLENLEEDTARELIEIIQGQPGADAELEPMEVDSERREWLRAEIPKWVKRRLILASWAAPLYRNYGIEPPPVPPTTKKERDPGGLVRAVLALGAILVGLGLILFIASNWQRIPAPVKIAGALLLTLVALHAAYRLRFVHDSHTRLASALFLLSIFGIGGVVVLIAQVYHVQADSYLLPLTWGALCVPVGLLLRFRPALYAASGLWFASYALYAGPHDHFPWFYPLLLLIFLLPYGHWSKDETFFRVHLAVLMLALAVTATTGDLWLCSTWLAAIAVLRVALRRPTYDWLLLLGSVFWHITFVVRLEDLPNGFYALPLGYFFYRGLVTRSNAMLIVNCANTLLWLLVLFIQIGERFDLAQLTATGFLLWSLSVGVLCFAVGRHVAPQQEWRSLSTTMRYGGALIAGLTVYVLTFRFYGDEEAFFESPLFLWSALSFLVVAMLLTVARLLTDAAAQRGATGELLLLSLVAASLLLSVLVPPALGVHVLLFNVILFVAAFVLMLSGHRRRRLLRYNVGIAIFVVLITSRYFDTFVELLPRSVFFLLGGVFLILWAMAAERRRRRAALRGAGDA